MSKQVGTTEFLWLSDDDKPLIMAALDGEWLLNHVRTSWRKENPQEGFQRVVNQDRCVQIAANVLDQGRSLPNSIILATETDRPLVENGRLILNNDSSFLVIDGQHRLYAQKFADGSRRYACIIHYGLKPEDMAQLFVEINNNQKRVSPSLRWDLLKLIRPDDDKDSVEAADIVEDLVLDKTSPIYLLVDMTGENRQLNVKQASIAHEIKTVIKSRDIRDCHYDVKLNTIKNYLAALKNLDGDQWGGGNSAIFNNRVLKAFLKLLPEIIRSKTYLPIQGEVETYEFMEILSNIDVNVIARDAIKTMTGNSGIKALTDIIKEQIKI